LRRFFASHKNFLHRDEKFILVSHLEDFSQTKSQGCSSKLTRNWKEKETSAA
jgi:hypothetical protein